MANWYWQREGDSIVIRDDPSGEDEDGEYVAEIDVRYLKPKEMAKAQETATRITNWANGAITKVYMAEQVEDNGLLLNMNDALNARIAKLEAALARIRKHELVPVVVRKIAAAALKEGS